MLIEELRKTNGEIYLKIHYDQVANCIIDEWDGNFGNQENFRKGLERIIENIRDKRCNKWLANLTNLKGSFDSSSDWLTSVIMPEAVDAGLKHEAVILPKNVFAKLSAKDAINEVKDVTISIFDDIDEGKEWLAIQD